MSAFDGTSDLDASEVLIPRLAFTKEAGDLLISNLQSALSSSTKEVDPGCVINSPVNSPTHPLSDWSLIPPATANETIFQMQAQDFHPVGPIFYPQNRSSTSVTNVFKIDNTIIGQYSRSVENGLKRAPGLSKDVGALGMLHFGRFRETSDPSELEEAIKYLGTAVVLLRHQSTQDSQLPILLYCLGCAFQSRFYRTCDNDIKDLDQAVPHYEDAIKFTNDEGSENLIAFHSDLGSAFQARFERRGGVSDVEGAVDNHRRALEVAGDQNQVLIPNLTSNLGISYQSRFERLGETSDLEQAIIHLHQSVQISSSDDSCLPSRLNNLGLSLQSRFEFDPSWTHSTFDNQAEDLEDAIQIFREAVERTNTPHPEWIANLGTAYRLKAEKDQELTVLEKAISFLQAAVNLSNDSSSIHHDFLPKYLGKLASCLTVKAHLDPSDQGAIDNAIAHFEHALELTPKGHDIERSAILLRLGDALRTCFKRTQDVDDAMRTMAVFQECSELQYGPIMARLQAAIRRAQIAHEDGEFMTALMVYTTAIDLLPQAAWIGQSVNSRRCILASQPATPAADATACAIEKRAYSKAIELLEQGRTIFWSQALQLRPDLTVLLAINPTLAEELETVAKELEPRTFEDSFHAQAHVTHSDREDSAKHHRAVAEKWQCLVDKVRKLPEMRDFLKPRPFPELQCAATCSPVIIANASLYRCDALIVRKDGPPIHVSLPDSSFGTLTQQARSHAIILLTDSPSFFVTLPILRALWNDIVSPVVDHLMEMGVPVKSRIWWCPTSELCTLPLHAAGPYRIQQKNLPDIYTSSYITTLSALIRARSNTFGQSVIPKLLVVGQPSKTLRNVQAEIDNTQQLGDFVDVLVGTEADHYNVLHGLQQHSWAHFACHGRLGNNTQPFHASFELHGGSCLTLLDLMQARLPHAELAFLSACHSAAGDTVTPDETIHLAAALQFCGFRSVVGTMWAMHDEDGPMISKEFYKHMFRKPGNKADFRDSAEALNLATRMMRKNRMPLECWILFVHIGA